jgi:tRNA (cmo5U34)-methyltransferase
MTASPEPRLYDFAQDWAAEYLAKARSQIPAYDTLFAMADTLLARELPDSARVLVVGGGGGQELCTLGLQRSWKMVVVDPSEPMCRAARSRALEAGVADRCRVHQGFVSELPANALFDAATCLLVLHFLDEAGQIALLHDIAARLKPGAPAVFAHLVARSDAAEHDWILRLWNDFLVHAGEPREVVEERALARDREVTLLSEDGFHWLLDEAGFELEGRISQTLLFSQWAVRRRA